jgi:acyl-CoA thioester hydrolase
VRIEVPLRWGDLDAQGHINNARYIDYLQDARADFLHELGIVHLLKEGFTVVTNQIEYSAPGFFSPDPLLVDVGVCAMDDDSVTLAYKLFQADTKVATAYTTLCGYDLSTHTRKSLPDYAQDMFASILEPIEPLRPIAWHDMNERAKVSTMKVRWSDVDAYDHVNNAKIFDFVQEGRIQFTAAPLRGMQGAPDEPEYMWFLVRQDAWYLESVTLRKDPYIVRTGVAKIGNTSLTFSSQVDDPLTGAICAQAAAVAVFATADGRPTPLTGPLRDTLSQYSLD